VVTDDTAKHEKGKYYLKNPHKTYKTIKNNLENRYNIAKQR